MHRNNSGEHDGKQQRGGAGRGAGREAVGGDGRGGGHGRGHGRGYRSLKNDAMVAVFASVAVVLGILESFIPFAIAVPGAKLGFANIMVLSCLYYFRGRDALMLILLKTLLTSFILGAFSTLLFSLMGSLASFMVMFLLLRLGRNRFSLIAISVMGGIAHNVGQLAAAALVLGSTSVFYYFPILFIAGIATGIFVGIAAQYLVGAIGKLNLFGQTMEKTI